MKSISIALLISSVAIAKNRTSIFKKPDDPQVEAPAQIKSKPAKTNRNGVQKITQSGNLPSEYARGVSPFSIEESPVVLPQNKVGTKFGALRSGDLVQATITESVFAFADSKSPVRALIQTGPLKGSILIGEASLEANSKRIQIEFKKFRDPFHKDIFQLQASAMDEKGILGLVGSLVSNEGKYFAAEVIAAGAAGYADSTISRTQNLLGGSSEVPSEDTFAKKALTSALSKTADRFSEKLKKVPEYSILEGPIQIQILILDQPQSNF